MGIGSVVSGVISAGTKLLGTPGVKEAVGAVASQVGGGGQAGGQQSPEEIAKKMMQDSFVEAYTKSADEQKAKMEEAIKKGDPGAVK